MLDLQTQRIKSKATELLSEIANKERLFEYALRQQRKEKWTGNDNDYYLSTSNISDMPILLQLFVEISDFFLGDI